MITYHFKKLQHVFLAVMMGAFIVTSSFGQAQPQLPAMSIRVADTVLGATENISFSGNVIITPKLINDPVFKGPKVLELVVDFSGVKGVGVASRQAYTTNVQAILHRPLLTLDVIEVVLPFTPTGGTFGSERTMMASFAVAFQPPTKVGITAKLTIPTFQ